MRNGNESKKMANYYYIDYYSLVISSCLYFISHSCIQQQGKVENSMCQEQVEKALQQSGKRITQQDRKSVV